MAGKKYKRIKDEKGVWAWVEDKPSKADVKAAKAEKAAEAKAEKAAKAAAAKEAKGAENAAAAIKSAEEDKDE